MAEVIAGLWTLTAILTAIVAATEADEAPPLTSILRVMIVILMVVTAFILVRWDSNRPRNQ